MALALSLHFDGATANAVRAVWDALARAGESRDMLDLGYPPHLTLIVVDDETLAPTLIGALGRLARLAPQNPALGIVRQFEATCVTWVSYVADRTPLDRLHASAAELFPIENIDPHYRPGLWTPHVTLALDGVAERLAEVARAAWTPRPIVYATRLEVARFPPAVTIAGVDLTSSSAA